MTVKIKFFYVSKDDLPCGRKSLDAYKAKVDRVQDVELNKENSNDYVDNSLAINNILRVESELHL